MPTRGGVDLQRCPYDGTQIEVLTPVGAPCVLVCATCRAQWEVHDSIPVRMVEPDWDVIGPVTEWQPEATLVTSRLVRALEARGRRGTGRSGAGGTSAPS